MQYGRDSALELESVQFQYQQCHLLPSYLVRVFSQKKTAAKQTWKFASTGYIFNCFQFRIHSYHL